ncbi:MAG TPA: cysteine--tRNA ligase [Acidimicrobiales bacterium]|nr:cysteine--tRNA ligase [Acidimicrobiales bacterium]
MLRLYDTAIGAIAPIETRDEGRFSMYICGPTVSGEPHLGHGRFTVVWDVFRRYLAWTGLDVRFVSNVTDIEDKIIARAAEEGRRPEEVAAHYEQVWWDTMDRLGVMRPDEAPHATAYVAGMIDLIGRLVAAGAAYQGGDGVYFAAESVAGYGLLARQSIESLRSGARIEASDEAGKRSPVDFALWKLAKAGEPAWDSPWGAGRPGWHTECVVMSLDLLGDGFDLHTGGLDLAFPHHENERAQALADGRTFSRRWAHHGMIEDERGEKMSKSVGNTLSLIELVDTYDPRSFRLQVLQSHYRSPMRVGPSTLSAGVAAVERLDTFAREFAGARGVTPSPEVLDRFRAAMDDDLDTPAAVRIGFDTLRETRETRNEESAAAVFEIFDRALGLPLQYELSAVPAEVLARGAERDTARAARDWGRADAIRAELQADGWTVEDGPDGTVIR